MQFKIESFFNPHLSSGADRIDAILTVTATHEGAPATLSGKGRAIAFIIDRSGSMEYQGRIEAAKHAARVGINLLDENTQFCVIAFNSQPQVLVPLTRASAFINKELAHRQVQSLVPEGGTAFSRALLAARQELDKLDGGIRYALFLTDGENDAVDRPHLKSVVEACKGRFQCDGRGIGSDWQKADLTFIANMLLGNADIIPRPEMMEAAFREAITAALARGVADVHLRLWTPRTVAIATVKQVSPEIIDLAALAVRKDDRTVEIPTGAWADESRDYHLTLTFKPGEIGDEMLACRPSLVYTDGGREIVFPGSPPVVATWTADETLATRIDPQVAHYTGQQELADSIREGLDARERGDVDQATKLLGKAAKIASDSGTKRSRGGWRTSSTSSTRREPRFGSRPASAGQTRWSSIWAGRGLSGARRRDAGTAFADTGGGRRGMELRCPKAMSRPTRTIAPNAAPGWPALPARSRRPPAPLPRGRPRLPVNLARSVPRLVSPPRGSARCAAMISKIRPRRRRRLRPQRRLSRIRPQRLASPNQLHPSR